MKNLQQGFGAIKEIKLMRNEDFFLQRFHFNNSRFKLMFIQKWFL